MDLKARLRHTLGHGRGTVEEVKDQNRPFSPFSRIPGHIIDTENGPFLMRKSEFSLAYTHGRHPLGEILNVDSKVLHLLTGDPGLLTFLPQQAAFIDTETTSLAGGAGVFVFMAGIGYVCRNVFRVEQYFMRDYDEERAMLTSFNRRVAGYSAMVSFFGKNFDRYRLEDRMTALHLKSALPVGCHLDLYHLGRRIYKGRFSNLKLRTLEEGLLSYKRKDDIPGAQCPEIYFRFLLGQDEGRIAGVFEHNLWDILSLASLAIEADRLAKGPTSPQDKYALACVHMKSNNMSKALPLLEQACQELTPGPEALDAHLRLVRLLKRQGAHHDLKERLNRLYALGPKHPEVLLELAKFYEHKCHEFSKALAFAQQALLCLEQSDDGSQLSARRIHGGIKRIQRLKKKYRASSVGQGMESKGKQDSPYRGRKA